MACDDLRFICHAEVPKSMQKALLQAQTMGVESEGQSQEQQLNIPPSIFRPQQHDSSAGETPDVCFVLIETSKVQNRLPKTMQHACIKGSGPKGKTIKPWTERVRDNPKAPLLKAQDRATWRLTCESLLQCML